MGRGSHKLLHLQTNSNVNPCLLLLCIRSSALQQRDPVRTAEQVAAAVTVTAAAPAR